MTTGDHEPIRALEPKSIWNAFVELNAVPRASKKEAAVSKFVAERGRRLNLETKVDELGNVLICKPGTVGYESHPTVVLQSHIDMVWQKNADTDFDFETQGIQMFVDGDWVRARGTTLGADNGIGVASIFAVLESDTLRHPPLECIFTIDEETGMTGAKELDASWLRGRVLLNLDTEQDNELTIGCAGGANVTGSAAYTSEQVAADDVSLKIQVRGLTGGHSGVDIHLGRANANKLMNRLLYQPSKKFGARLSKLEGGGLRNAIPRESTAYIYVPKSKASDWMDWLKMEVANIQMENSVTDPNLQIEFQAVDAPTRTVMPLKLQRTLLSVVDGIPSGIHRMSPSIPGLVQTSNNLARVLVDAGEVSVLCLARSSVDSERDALCEGLTSILDSLDGSVDVSGQYPGWRPEPASQIVKLMSALYQEMFHEPAHVAACHAGLECGIIGDKFLGMEMISFGPNIFGAHSPDERVQISSVQKFFRYFCETLARL